MADATMTIKLSSECRKAIEEHASSAFPEECCGTMLGVEDANGHREISKVIAVPNVKGENRKRRYLIDPKALLGAEKQARNEKLDVLGIYHSHPNHPSQASEFDREHAMPFWSYVIISCMEGKPAGMQSWRLRDDRSVFDEEALE